MINLYLDDLRDRPEGFIVARTFEEALQVFQEHTINLLSLDHDLGEDEYGNELQNGYDFVKYFCENGLRANKIYLTILLAERICTKHYLPRNEEVLLKPILRYSITQLHQTSILETDNALR